MSGYIKQQMECWMFVHSLPMTAILGVAVLLVVFYHAGWLLPGGFVGVDVPTLVVDANTSLPPCCAVEAKVSLGERRELDVWDLRGIPAEVPVARTGACP